MERVVTQKTLKLKEKMSTMKRANLPLHLFEHVFKTSPLCAKILQLPLCRNKKKKVNAQFQKYRAKTDAARRRQLKKPCLNNSKIREVITNAKLSRCL